MEVNATVSKNKNIPPPGVSGVLWLDKNQSNRMKIRAEEIRIRYLYRHLILRGKVKVSFETARRLVGPDCAYHLYPVIDLEKRKTRELTNTRRSRQGSGSFPQVNRITK
jgi:hypothetical protein